MTLRATARPAGAARQSQPFGIEMRDEYKLVHTSSKMIARMEGVVASRYHHAALEKDPVSCALMSDL